MRLTLILILGWGFVVGQPAGPDHLREAFEASEGDSVRWALENKIGYWFFRQERYDSALVYFTRHLEQCETMGYDALVMSKLNGIGLVQHMSGEHTDAHPYFQNLLSLYEKSPLPWAPSERSTLLLNTAANFGAVEKADSAHLLFARSLDYARSVRDKELLALVTETIGNFFFRLWEQKGMAAYIDSSTTYYQQSLALRPPEAATAQARLGTSIGSNFFKLNAFASALEWYQRAALIEQDTLVHQGKSFQGLSKTYAALGDYETAYRYRLQYEAATDTLYYRMINQRVQELLTAFEAERTGMENERLRLTNSAQKDLLWQRTVSLLVIAVLLAVLLLLSLLLYRQYRRTQAANVELALRNQELITEREQLELKALVAQMNPHFIFNALNSVQRFILSRDIPQANTFLSRFGKMIRNVLELSTRRMVPFSEEIALLERYIALENSRLDHRLKLEWSIPEHLDPETLQIPPLLLQPFIENSIWHGLPPDDITPLTIHIRLEQPALNQVSVTLSDDGAGDPGEVAGDLLKAVEERTVSGIQIARNRLIALWRKYPDAIADPVEITTAHGFCVKLILPHYD
jgi:hypothetical protein